ncbi:DNA topoisomerase [Vibrio sp. D431a]|uniref:DNA topoisomerase n=1 Tax=Vibrio sp. D431a TaxID=2837388 RepID=UPI00255555B7|nr:DNA topoisomerase [Vibrio sp. D431a]MDK9793834.1 topoisomerase DNA-binding C4 zinc finger domain-containing protein [Vibrio sp. D431a]
MSKILYIAEKPSVGKAIAAAIGAKTPKGNCLQTSDGEVVVTWLFGHILELVDAESYDEKFLKWTLKDLPIIPDKFLMRPPIDRPRQKIDNKYRRDQLDLIKRLVSQTDEVCIATDPDAEGELLGVEVLEFINYKGKRTRVLPTALDAATINAAISNKKPASESWPLYMGGMARRDIDWTVGINITRALTTFNRSMIDSPLNAGRVQTFIVGLLYNRHIAIKNFKPQNTYMLEFEANETPSYTLKWQKGSNSELFDTSLPTYTPEKAKEVIDQVILNCNGHDMVVQSCKKERKKSAPKLGFSLTDLQIECSRRLGISGAETLAMVQKLYDAKYVTYPRSDCKYMPKSQHGEAKKILQVCRERLSIPENIKTDCTKISRAWNDSKIENHHAIIPTAIKPKDDLPPKYLQVYEIIANRYIIQFMDDYEYDSTIIESDCNGNKFKASGNVPVSLGWKELESNSGSEDDNSDSTTLPVLNSGDIIAGSFKTQTSKTSAPKPFTEVMLLTTLVSAYKLVTDEVLAKNLKDRDKGIGTVATTANIIDQLITNRFITVKKKKYELTKKGMLMAQIAPSFLLDADTTAKLDYKLVSIESGEDTYDNVVGDYKQLVRQMVKDIQDGKSALPEPLLPSEPCPYCKEGLTVRRKSNKNGFFWTCIHCGEIATDNFGQPEKRVTFEKIDCSDCNTKTLTRYPIKDSKAGLFTWYCTGCKKRANDFDGKPDFTVHKCPKCQKALTKIFSKKHQKFFWICEDKESCGNLLNDNDNKPEAFKPNYETLNEKCPACKSGNIQKREGKHGEFYTCSNWTKDGSGCSAKIIKNDSGFSVQEKLKGLPCPSCKSGTIYKREGQYGDFWSCSNWNKKGKLKCEFRAQDDNGKPAETK